MIPVKTTRQTRSIEGEGCASSAGKALFPAAGTKPAKRGWISNHELWITQFDGQDRVITPVVVGSNLFWMDAITGGFGIQHGARVRRNQVRLEEILMAVKKGRKEE